ncbi:MAG: class I SAM-dependent methyltransferase [Owenweeksia sp.]|nr:class I SAM-dependent methyltransferase [Owenweeksia sp.]
MRKSINEQIFSRIDRIFRKKDKQHIRRTRNLRLIPAYKNRRGGKLSYAEWAHVIGTFQSLFYQVLPQKSGNHILDIGCGTGLLGIAAEPFTSEGGSYTGIDVIQSDIDFCKNHYQVANYDFIHLDVANPTYTHNQPNEQKPWPVNGEKYDLVTGLSVWTHLNESDARFYFKEISRVLKKGAKPLLLFSCWMNFMKSQCPAG